MSMRMKRNQYVRAFVAARNTERRYDKAEEQWQRWLQRIDLARLAGKPELARIARRQALRSAETAIAMQSLLRAQLAEVDYLADDIRCRR
ncbi:MAG: hypothetical protein ACLFVO_17105 [Chloroflexaceae bacterium]